MAYSILGFITGFGYGRSVGLDNSQAARVAILPGILGFNIVSILVAKAVADREAESLSPPVPRKAAIEVAPDSHIYGNVNVGSSASKIFVVSNRGTADLEVNATTLSGTDAGQFAIVSGNVISGGNPLKVAPGAIHTVEVSFTPTSAGEKSASLDTTSNDPDQPTVNITLSGTGMAAPSPDITVAPASHDYSNVNLHSSACKIFVVSNKGTADLVVAATALSGTNANEFAIVSGSVSSGNPLKVAPGATHNVEVRFTPTSTGLISTGEKNASLDITSNDPEKFIVNIKLSGNGVTSPV